MPSALRQHELGDPGGGHVLEVELTVHRQRRQEVPGDTGVVANAGRRKAALFCQVAPVALDQEPDRCHRGDRLEGRDDPGALQVVEQRRHLVQRQRADVAGRPSPAQELLDSRRCQILGVEVLAGEPAAHLGHRVELVTRRSVALLGEILLEVNGVAGQRPLYMHMRWFAHGRSSHLESKERSLRRTPGLCRASQRSHGTSAGQTQAVPTILGIIRNSA